MPGASQLVIWKDKSEFRILKSNGGIWYSATLDDKSVTTPVITIRSGKLVSINTGKISIIKELPSGKCCSVLLKTKYTNLFVMQVAGALKILQKWHLL